MYANVPDEVLDLIIDDWDNSTVRDVIDQVGEELEAARFRTNEDGDRLEFFQAWSENHVFYYHGDGAFSGIFTVPRNPPDDQDVEDDS